MVIPYVVERENGVERSMDVYSRLLKDRVVFLGTGVDSQSANAIIAQLLFLSASDPKADIHFYINSPGGSVSDGLGILDTINHIGCDVRTYCIGQACSMGALLLSAGTKGKRFVLPNARVMIHQPSGGAQGTATDVEIRIEEMFKYKKKLTNILAINCGKEYNEVYKDCERDYFMSAEEAVDYGIVDQILTNDGGTDEVS